MAIIQHHAPVDFDQLLQAQKEQYIGIDINDFVRVQTADCEVHSFMGSAEWKDRVFLALVNSIASDEVVELINKAHTAAIIILRSSQCDRPLTIEEVKRLPEFISGLPEDCEVVWNIADDDTLGNRVKTILLIGIDKRS